MINFKVVNKQKFINYNIQPLIMTIRKTLTSIVLAGALLTGCKVSQREYNMKVGEDQIELVRKRYFPHQWNTDTLTVTKPDGRIIKYVDEIDCLKLDSKLDSKLDYIEITEGERKTKYTDDEIGTLALEEAQKLFDAYMKQFTNQGIEDLK